jgi:thioester reductase-like protein
MRGSERFEARPGVVLTGATGFLGGEVLARLLERDGRPIYVLVRAESQEAARSRLRDTLRGLMGASEPWAERVTAVPADLTRDDLGLSPEQRDWLAARTSWVIHCAASVSFTLGLAESREINVEGTRRMLDLARAASRGGTLRCFTHVSTAYVAGTHDGTFGERDLDLGQEHRNPYERSKLEAEQLLRSEGDGLPVCIVRPSIVVGDSRTGWTPAFNVLYWPLRAFARGNYPVLPASGGSPVDVVPVDYVADALLELGETPGGTFNLTASERACELGELVELACDHLGRKPPRLLPPKLYRRLVHPLLVRTGSEKRRRALRNSEVFFPYFSMATRYDAAHARGALRTSGIEPPALPAYFDRLIDYAVRAEWGRKPVPRHRVLAPSRAHHGRTRPTRRRRDQPEEASARSPSAARAARTRHLSSSSR